MTAKRRMRAVAMGILTAALSVALIIFAAVGLINSGKSMRSRQLKTVTQAVDVAVNECYALEGSYPPSLEYLHENYGLVLDTQHYIYDYSVFASNIPPEIHVLAKS
jgi:hypothetical protein